jgi:hypothetical protein
VNVEHVLDLIVYRAVSMVVIGKAQVQRLGERQ